MTETVIPATYVEVRAEGLSSAGGVGAGAVGVVGTTAGGVVGEAVTPGGLAGAREVSGAPDEYGRPLGEVPLTLVRALELVYANGASPVIAVRVAGAARDAAAFVLKNATGGAVATLTARHPGTDGNGTRVLVTQRGGRVERHTVPDGTLLAERVNAGSALATAVADPVRGTDRPATGTDGYIGTGANAAGANGELAGPDDHRAGRHVDIVLLAGRDAGQTTGMGAVLLGHLDATQQSDHGRMGVLGAPGSTVADFLGHSLASDRVVVVAPGLRTPDAGSGRRVPGRGRQLVALDGAGVP